MAQKEKGGLMETSVSIVKQLDYVQKIARTTTCWSSRKWYVSFLRGQISAWRTEISWNEKPAYHQLFHSRSLWEQQCHGIPARKQPSTCRARALTSQDSTAGHGFRLRVLPARSDPFRSRVEVSARSYKLSALRIEGDHLPGCVLERRKKKGEEHFNTHLQTLAHARRQPPNFPVFKQESCDGVDPFVSTEGAFGLQGEEHTKIPRLPDHTFLSTP
ncbi:hypothetical protein BDV96DRAFT_585200 [Lophiotrema nucula]|uniref:Uncharacterized protein n=1 Tax=Lophiotrema nucula TaxID=690887 RepID=A0A6A5YR08_9PLEO|nr:hypothetical protein BDV96DRAFT_585200 [Lophiotrema nucula]